MPRKLSPPKTRVAKISKIVRKLITYKVEGKKSTARLSSLKVFPPSKPGKTKFRPIPKQPTTKDFRAWFDYFVSYIGATVEELNGRQFNLDKKSGRSALNAAIAAFADRLECLAESMQIGKKPNPSMLIWPLNGVYICDLKLPVSGPSKIYRVKLVVSFEADLGYQVVTNCSVLLIEPSACNDAAPDAPVLRALFWDSSSSSYLATSSSSSLVKSGRPLQPAISSSLVAERRR
jgi:hypothetical protein